MKRLFTIFIALIIALMSIVSASAADYDCTLSLDSKVQTGKSFKVQLSVLGSGDVAAAIFTVCFDSSVMELKSAGLADGIDGKLEYNVSGGTASLVFLNVGGEQLSSDEKNIITLNFKASATPCRAYITLYCEQAVSSDESRLSGGFGVEYPVEFAEKVSGSVSRSSGTKVSSSSSGSSKSPSSKNSASGASRVSGQEHTNASTSFSQGTVTSLGSSGNSQSHAPYIFLSVITTLFVVGAGIAVYIIGRKHGESHKAQQDKDDNPDKATDKDNKKPSDSAFASLDDMFSSDNPDLFDEEE
ncbi:MAG: cohesin domain-containing protein [Acutalibacteraceae bacterium]